MAHELATVDGRTAMMYVGEAPWHGLGTRLAAPATAREAMETASLDYHVVLTGMTTAGGVPVPSRKAVVRTDTDEVLGVVGDSYVPVQNREAFAFLDSVAADGALRYHTAGALRKGEKVWMMARLPGHIRVRSSEDVSEKYLLLSNSHDGSSALRVFFTSVRVVCANTLAMADRRGRGEGVSVRHRGDLTSRIGQAREVLGIAARHFDDLEGRFGLLARHHPSHAQVSAYFKSLYPDPEQGNPSRSRNVRDELFRLFEGGKGQDIPEIRRTSWAMFNALTEYVDHHRPTRAGSARDRAANRLDSSWFGSGARLKEAAFNLALEMAVGD